MRFWLLKFVLVKSAVDQVHSQVTGPEEIITKSGAIVWFTGRNVPSGLLVLKIILTFNVTDIEGQIQR